MIIPRVQKHTCLSAQPALAQQLVEAAERLISKLVQKGSRGGSESACSHTGTDQIAVCPSPLLSTSINDIHVLQIPQTSRFSMCLPLSVTE